KLASDLKQLEAEYNMYFSGRLPRPPWETRTRVNELIKSYDRVYIANTGDRFRFATLQGRFATFTELWDRGLRALEEGRPGPFTYKRVAFKEAKKKATEDHILHVASFIDPVKELD